MGIISLTEPSYLKLIFILGGSGHVDIFTEASEINAITVIDFNNIQSIIVPILSNLGIQDLKSSEK